MVKARTLYTEKRDHFRKLSEVHRASVPNWYRMDTRPKVTPDGEIQSVYRNSTSKGTTGGAEYLSLAFLITLAAISIDSIHQNLLRIGITSALGPGSQSALVAQTAYFLVEGI